VIAVLSDAASEDEQVNATEESRVRADNFAHGSGKDVQRKSGAGIVDANPLYQRLHIALTGGESEETALMVEQIFKLIDAEFLIAQKIEEDAGVEIAGARAHGDAAGGSESHRRVDGYSAAKSAEACSVTQVGEDGSPWKPRSEVMHERFIREAVEAVAPDTGIEISLRNR